MLDPSKMHVLLEISVENKAFNFSKRALGAGTARTKWLKYVLCTGFAENYQFLILDEIQSYQ